MSSSLSRDKSSMACHLEASLALIRENSVATKSATELLELRPTRPEFSTGEPDSSRTLPQALGNADLRAASDVVCAKSPLHVCSSILGLAVGLGATPSESAALESRSHSSKSLELGITELQSPSSAPPALLKFLDASLWLVWPPVQECGRTANALQPLRTKTCPDFTQSGHGNTMTNPV